MRTATADIKSLMDRVDRREIRLPEIQRGYVWKPAQIAGLLDSLYRRYPSGSLLLWETDTPVEERDAAIEPGTSLPLAKPQYLLDGQQRLTSLHRAFKGHGEAHVVFNVETEKFQIESAATAKDPRWIRVAGLLNGSLDTYQLVSELQAKIPNLPPAQIHGRLEGVRKIAEYSYYIEILENLPYEEVTQIFVRVNSRGRPLKTTDLALATLSARWPGVIVKFDAQQTWCATKGYGDLDFAFLTRCLAALATDTATPAGFSSVGVKRLGDAWRRVQRGIEHLVGLLKSEADIATSGLLPSVNALIPLVAYLGSRDDKPLGEEERRAIVYWLFGAFVTSRFSAGADTLLAQDVVAVRSSDPIPNLLKNLGLLGQKLTVSEEMLAGKGSTSPFFLLSYLAARRRKAKDWWFGVDICTDGAGQYAVEYHHVHPRATLKKHYQKAEINDLANLAFISSRANRKIGRRSPARYFPEVGDEELDRHLVPLDPALRTADAYPTFVRERRRALAAAMTELLESYRPALFDQTATALPASSGAASLAIESFGTSADAADVVLHLTATVGDQRWTCSIEHAGLAGLLDDLSEGRAGELAIAGESIFVPAASDDIQIPVGPLLVKGQLTEWRKVLDRELEDLEPGVKPPTISPPAPWHGERRPFWVLDSD